MKTTLKKRLLDALNACHAIQSFIANRTFAEYEQNQMLRSAVERQFEIIGEALNQAEIDNSELSTLIPDVRRIIGMRNRIIHGYDSVDDEFKRTFRHWRNVSPSYWNPIGDLFLHGLGV
jgi:uncharacterized protein with HEPN domain